VGAINVRRKMNFNLQCDPKWGSLTYDGKNTFCASGCFVCSLSMLCGKTPPETAKILKNNGLFTNGYLNDSVKAAQVLGLEYNGKSLTKPPYDTIAETNYFAPNVPQHFFIKKADNSQVDPLGKSIVYPIVSYRLFKRKDDMWYSINGTVFNNDNYVTDPNSVPWHEVIATNPRGYELLPFGTKSALESKLGACEAKPAEVKEVIKEVPVEVIKEKIVYKEKELTIGELIGRIWEKIRNKKI